MTTSSELENHLADVLDRRVKCASLPALVSAMRPQDSAVAISETAIALDANVLLRISAHAKGADIIDYLSSKHAAPLILPGQSIQEFWNNQLHAVDTIAASLHKKYEAFKSEVAKVDKNFGPYVAQIEESLRQFSEEHGHIYDEGTIRKTLAFLEGVQAKASVPYVSRGRFHEIANHRKSTKTPPGFRDDGDGDFYIWADLLLGLQEAHVKNEKFARVVLVSLDRKVDWSRSGTAHPLLVAEVNTLLGVPFETWTIDKLVQEIARAA